MSEHFSLIGSRPGYAPEYFSHSLTGYPTQAPDIVTLEDGPVDSVDGRVIPLVGAKILTLRDAVPIEPGVVYRLLWQARAATDTADPSGDTIRFGVQWLDANLASIGQLSHSSLNQAPSVASGLITTEKFIGPGADFAIPDTAKFFRPYIQNFGTATRNAVTIGWHPLYGEEAAGASILAQTQAVLTSFRNIFLGAYASAPSTTPSGAALTEGMTYYDTTLDTQRFYDGASWQNAPYATVEDDAITLVKMDPDAKAPVNLGRVRSLIAANTAINVAVYGDSIMYGYQESGPVAARAGLSAGLTRSALTPVQALASALSVTAVTIVDKTIPGDNSGDGLGDYIADSGTYAAVYISFGVNDAGGDDIAIEDYRENLVRFASLALSRGQVPIFVTPIPVNSAASSRKVQAYAAVMEGVAEKMGCLCINSVQQLARYAGAMWAGDGIHILSGEINGELGWHLAAPLLAYTAATGTVDPRSEVRRVGPGTVMTPREFWGALSGAGTVTTVSGVLVQQLDQGAILRVPVFVERECHAVFEILETAGDEARLATTYVALTAVPYRATKAGTTQRFTYRMPERLLPGYRVLNFSVPTSGSYAGATNLVRLAFEDPDGTPRSASGAERLSTICPGPFPTGGGARIDHVVSMPQISAVEAELTLASGVEAGLMLAYSATSNLDEYGTTSYLALRRYGDTGLRITSPVGSLANTMTSVFSSSTPWTGILRIENDGTNTIIKVDGVQKGSYSSAIFGGSPGIIAVGDAGASKCHWMRTIGATERTI